MQTMRFVMFVCGVSPQILHMVFLRKFFPCSDNLHLWSIMDSNKCVHYDDIDTISHYFAEFSKYILEIIKNMVHAYFPICYQFHCLRHFVCHSKL